MKAFGRGTIRDLPFGLRQILFVAFFFFFFFLSSLDLAHGSSWQNEDQLLEGSLRRHIRESPPNPQPPSNCTEGQFACEDGQCIPRTFLCDGVRECFDGSDEKNCGGCRPEEFRCGDGACIPRNKRCDGNVDCAYGSDERDNCCKANEFQCSNMVCIPENQKCNGKAECKDSSDEYLCDPYPESGAHSAQVNPISVSASCVHCAPWILPLLLFSVMLSNSI